MELNQFQCENCGAPLSQSAEEGIYECRYCEAKYSADTKSGLWVLQSRGLDVKSVGGTSGTNKTKGIILILSIGMAILMIGVLVAVVMYLQ